MKFYLIFPGLFLSFAILLSGCSWQCDLYVFNRSGNKVFVHYTVPSGNPNQAVSAFSIRKWAKNEINLGEPINVYSRLENDSTMYVELPAGTALVLRHTLNRNLMLDADCKEILTDLKNLSILSGSNALLQCKDVNCLPQLEHFNKSQAGFVMK